MSKEQIKKAFESKEVEDVLTRSLYEAIFNVLDVLIQETKQAKLEYIPLKILEKLRDKYSKDSITWYYRGLDHE